MMIARKYEWDCGETFLLSTKLLYEIYFYNPSSPTLLPQGEKGENMLSDYASLIEPTWLMVLRLTEPVW